MERDRDIYNKPGPAPKAKTEYQVDLTLAEARAITYRRIIFFVVLLLVVLGVTSWVVMLQEWRDRLAEERVEESLSAAALRVERGTNALPVRPPPADLGPMLDGLDLTRAEAPRGMDPAKVAEAMGHVRMADQYMREREFDLAEARVRQALAIWPDMNAAIRALGFIYMQRGQFDQAIALFTRSLQSDPANAETYNSLAAAYMQKGQMDLAEDMLNTALEMRPDYVFAYLNLGMMHLATARYDLAVDYLGYAVDRLPDHPNIRNNLSVALLRVGRHSEARDHLRLLIRSHPDVPSWYFNMAISYTEERNYEEAMHWIQRGADYCSPIQFEHFISDGDFDELRQQPAYENRIRSLFPDLSTI